MKKFLIGGAAAAAVVGGAAIAQTAPQPTKPTRAAKAQVQNRADVHAQVQKMFSALDANRDGFVTKAEMDTRDTKRAARLESRAQRLDPAQMFGRLDANKDGRITQAEAEAARTVHAQGKPGQPTQAHATAVGGLFTRGDVNKDGVITRAEFDSMTAQLQARRDKAAAKAGRGARMLDLADANKDGRLSLAEAQAAALARFDRADLNRDGKLTADERQQVRKQARGQRRPS